MTTASSSVERRGDDFIAKLLSHTSVPPGLSFTLLHQAFVHRSARAVGYVTDNEVLEFHGDRLLSSAIALYLERRSRGVRNEAWLSLMTSRIANNTFLGKLAGSLGFDKMIVVGPSLSSSGGTSDPRLLACAFEAFVGALYRTVEDHGRAASQAAESLQQTAGQLLSDDILSPTSGDAWRAVVQFVATLLDVHNAIDAIQHIESKPRLQEITQHYIKTPPEYGHEDGGVDTHFCELTLWDGEKGAGTGTSAQLARHAAALDVLKKKDKPWRAGHATGFHYTILNEYCQKHGQCDGIKQDVKKLDNPQRFTATVRIAGRAVASGRGPTKGAAEEAAACEALASLDRHSGKCFTAPDFPADLHDFSKESFETWALASETAGGPATKRPHVSGGNPTGVNL